MLITKKIKKEHLKGPKQKQKRDGRAESSGGAGGSAGRGPALVGFCRRPANSGEGMGRRCRKRVPQSPLLLTGGDLGFMRNCHRGGGARPERERAGEQQREARTGERGGARERRSRRAHPRDAAGKPPRAGLAGRP